MTSTEKKPRKSAVTKAKPALPAIPRPQAVESVKQTLEVGAAKLLEAAPRITELVLSYDDGPEFRTP